MAGDFSSNDVRIIRELAAVTPFHVAAFIKWRQHSHRMIRLRAKAAGMKMPGVGNHSLRATGITAYLKNKGLLEHAQTLANHASPRTTKLYDRRQDEISLDEVEKISF